MSSSTTPDSPPAASGPASAPPAPWATRSRTQRIGAWGLGLVRTSGRYAFHRVPMFRRGRRGNGPPDLPDLDREVVGDAAGLQRAADGFGPLYHRRYGIAFTDSEFGPTELMQQIRADVNSAVPTELARFESRDGGPCGPVEVGEEFLVRLPGPWNGPVRVVETDDTSFTLLTLDGHMEAGQITFRTGTHPQHGWVTFEIESFARSGSRMFHLLYDRLPFAREMQLHMWASFCEKVADLAGGIVMTSVEVDTHTYPEPGEEPCTEPVSEASPS